MPRFFVADLSVQGEQRDLTEYSYELLERIHGATDLIARCSGHLWKEPEGFETPLTDTGLIHIRWRATAPTAGIATVRGRNASLISISLLASGKDRDADQTTLAVMQNHLVQELHQTRFEPAFDLMHLANRPLLATLTFTPGPNDASSNPADKMAGALADRCFAAAYFRYLGLA
jgi:hypothetical protein